MKHRLLALFLSLSAVAGAVQPLPPATAAKLPRWRGFNLTEKFRLDWGRKPFVEEDFRLISSLGFNYVRLPLDYRFWIKDGDWTQFDEGELKQIDQAIAWGKAYGLHITLNIHRIPGYCVNPPKEAKDLWTDAEAQRVAALHWAMFAKRYKGIPNDQLSFDLLNEPSEVSAQAYAKVITLLAEAIRREDPSRLMIADGLDGGFKPVPELLSLGVAQSGRGYLPFEITHYDASWIAGHEKWPKPQWPKLRLGSHLYGSLKPELQGPLRLEGPFAKGAKLRLHLDMVSQKAHITIKAGAKVLMDQVYIAGPKAPGAKEVKYLEQYKVYQCVYDKDLVCEVPAGTQAVELAVAEGDWLSYTQIGITPKGGTEALLLPIPDEWGLKPGTVFMDAAGTPDLSRGMAFNKQWLFENVAKPWKDLEAKGVGIMIGEWGVFDHTPHGPTLALMEDYLKLFQEQGIGWALWNFRGGFGVMDTNRGDVKFEDWQGHKLDRQMLTILQKY